MRNFVLLLLIIFISNSCYASQYSNILDKIENNIYGFSYMDSDESRVTRLEQSIYGESKTNKPLQERISNLNKDMSADSIGQEITPKEDTFMDDESEIYDRTASNSSRAKMPPAGANVDYPSINELENKVFKTEYKTKDLTERLAGLEKKTFGKTYDSEDFSSRVERLQEKIIPQKLAKGYDYEYYNDLAPIDENYKLDEYSSPDFDYGSYNAKHTPLAKINIASVEKFIFKKSFNSEDMNKRLSRLESTMFGTTFDTEDQQSRINRIASAYKATKTAHKYDSNKFTQNMAAATQIGMLILMILACVL